mgnify:CR=1 FL=1
MNEFIYFETLSYLCDYVHRRLAKEGIQFNSTILQHYPANTKTADALETDCLEFENIFLLRPSKLDVLKTLSEDNLSEVMDAIQVELFNDAINWGLIVALFSTVGHLASSYVHQGRSYMVQDLVASIGDYFFKNSTKMDNFLEPRRWGGYILKPKKKNYMLTGLAFTGVAIIGMVIGMILLQINC